MVNILRRTPHAEVRLAQEERRHARISTATLQYMSNTAYPTNHGYGGSTAISSGKQKRRPTCMKLCDSPNVSIG